MRGGEAEAEDSLGYDLTRLRRCLRLGRSLALPFASPYRRLKVTYVIQRVLKLYIHRGRSLAA